MSKLVTPRVFHAALDDTIVMLKEIHEQRDQIRSIFEHPVLHRLRQFHKQYGAVFSLYLFYEVRETPDGPAFDLSQMTDRFREEWIANSDWLRLSFHSRTRIPKKVDYYLYFERDYETARRDFEQIKAQILRFAGEPVWDNFPRTHFWSGNRETVRAWRDCGVSGLFYSHPGFPALHFTNEQLEELWQKDYFDDPELDLLFITTNVKLPCVTVDEVRQRLAALTEHRILEIFADDYNLLELDEHMDVALRWAVEHGYQPAFYDQAFGVSQTQKRQISK